MVQFCPRGPWYLLTDKYECLVIILHVAPIDTTGRGASLLVGGYESLHLASAYFSALERRETVCFIIGGWW